jgi:hypothetical protein
MRVYHFLKKKYGIQALRDKRLKVARISELNDPFELLAPRLSEPVMRQAFSRTKAELAENRGLLCFSKGYKNPVLWSHYADRHRGICVGFDVPDDLIMHVTYTTNRPPPDDLLSGDKSVREEAMKKSLATKFSHWRYESEVRFFVALDERDARTGNYFYDFSDHLILKQVIVGSESKITRGEVSSAIGQQGMEIESFKVRPAFRSFKIVRNRSEAMWA